LVLLPGARAKPLGELALKGKAEPVKAYQLISLGTGNAPS
jgi:class 3 adenylate cyclase